MNKTQNNFTLQQIRPADVMKRYWELRAGDLARVIDPTTGALRRTLSLDRPCPCCGASAAKPSFRKDGFDFVTCESCRHLYVNPTPTDAALSSWYATSVSQKWFESQALSQSMDVRIRRIFQPRLEEMARMLPTRGRLLDVGCSRGYFLALAREMGWEPYGVEIDPALAEESAQRAGCKTWGRRFEEADLPKGHFDVVTLWEVIEHVIDPGTLVRKVLEVLRPGGLFVLTTPNIDGIEFRAVGPAHKNIEAPAHINYFAPDTLQRLLEKAGFGEVRITTPGRLDVDNLLDALRDLPDPGVGGRFLLQLAESPAFEEVRDAAVRAIQKSNWSGNMQAVARKP